MTDEISSGNLRSPTTIILVGERRALNALPLCLPVSSWVAKSLGLWIPKIHGSIWTVDLSTFRKSWERPQDRNLSELSYFG
jgi:hypothetical protein